MELPKQYPPYQTCHRRFMEWMRSGTIEDVLRALADDLKLRGNLKVDDLSLDVASTIANVRERRRGATRDRVRVDDRRFGEMSWQEQTAMIFQATPRSKILRHLDQRVEQPAHVTTATRQARKR